MQRSQLTVRVRRTNAVKTNNLDIVCNFEQRY
jgi:hypothetical protein